MTAHKHLKRLIRVRAAANGEHYTAARRHVQRRLKEEPVSSTEETTKELIAKCSFCLKNNTQVQKLVAGPGVYICDECVALCQALVSAPPGPEGEASAQFQFQNRSVEDRLALLPAMAATAAEVEAGVRRAVRQLRDLGEDWDRIAAALQTDIEAVRQRFDPAW
jgi:hypothetical protein